MCVPWSNCFSSGHDFNQLVAKKYSYILEKAVKEKKRKEKERWRYHVSTLLTTLLTV